jgi:hypothetical protein
LAASRRRARAKRPRPSIFASLDINKAKGWGDALAACDMTRFFLSNPDLEAGTIIAPGGGILYKPLFIPEKLLYTPSLLEAFNTLKAAGQVKREEVVEARFEFASTLIPQVPQGRRGRQGLPQGPDEALQRPDRRREEAVRRLERDSRKRTPVSASVTSQPFDLEPRRRQDRAAVPGLDQHRRAQGRIAGGIA